MEKLIRVSIADLDTIRIHCKLCGMISELTPQQFITTCQNPASSIATGKCPACKVNIQPTTIQQGNGFALLANAISSFINTNAMNLEFTIKE